MIRQVISVGFGLGLLLAMSGQSRAGTLDPKVNVHEIANQAVSAECGACHVNSPKPYDKPNSIGLTPNWDDYRANGSDLCLGCHDEEGGGHEVGGAVDFDVPADLPLGEGKTVICMTCHYTHGSLKSDRPWAAVSFMDKMTGNERLNRTYLLRRNNAGGELCLICHDTTNEKRQ